MCDRIKVVARIRPLIAREGTSSETLWAVQPGGQIIQSKDGSRTFTLDQAYDQDAQTSEIFTQQVAPIVDDAMQGYQGTIFAYGQTSSGKTFTMMGNKKSPGIIPMAIKEIYRCIENTANRLFMTYVQYVEIYNEAVFDLLASERTQVEVREDVDCRVHIKASEVTVCSVEAALHLIQVADGKRRTASTSLNEHSSRSHSIFRIVIESKEGRSTSNSTDGDMLDGSGDDGVAVLRGELNLVDLAGSENAGKANTAGQRLLEGGYINKSLLTLSSVIRELCEGKSGHISYRDSKLTRILSEALGGNSKTAIICNITPANMEETTSTLRFASNAKTITNKPHVTEVLDDKAKMKQLQKLLKERDVDREKMRKFEDDLREKEQIIINLKEKFIIGGMAEKKAKKIRRQTWCTGLARTSFGSSRDVFRQSSPAKYAFKPEGALVSLEEETDSTASASATPFKTTSEEMLWDAECQTEDDGLEAELEQLRLENIEKSEIINGLLQTQSDMEGTYLVTQVESDRLRQELLAECNMLRAQVNQLQTVVDASAAELNQKDETLIRGMETLAREREDHGQQMYKLRQEVNAAEKARKTAEAELEKCRKERDTAQHALQESRDLHATDLLASYTSEMNKYHALMKEHATLLDKYQMLEQQYREVVKELEEQNELHEFTRFERHPSMMDETQFGLKGMSAGTMESPARRGVLSSPVLNSQTIAQSADEQLRRLVLECSKKVVDSEIQVNLLDDDVELTENYWCLMLEEEKMKWEHHEIAEIQQFKLAAREANEHSINSIRAQYEAALERQKQACEASSERCRELEEKVRQVKEDLAQVRNQHRVEIDDTRSWFTALVTDKEAIINKLRTSESTLAELVNSLQAELLAAANKETCSDETNTPVIAARTSFTSSATDVATNTSTCVNANEKTSTDDLETYISADSETNTSSWLALNAADAETSTSVCFSTDIGINTSVRVNTNVDANLSVCVSNDMGTNTSMYVASDSCLQPNCATQVEVAHSVAATTNTAVVSVAIGTDDDIHMHDDCEKTISELKRRIQSEVDISEVEAMRQEFEMRLRDVMKNPDLVRDLQPGWNDITATFDVSRCILVDSLCVTRMGEADFNATEIGSPKTPRKEIEIGDGIAEISKELSSVNNLCSILLQLRSDAEQSLNCMYDTYTLDIDALTAFHGQQLTELKEEFASAREKYELKLEELQQTASFLIQQFDELNDEHEMLMSQIQSDFKSEMEAAVLKEKTHHEKILRETTAVFETKREKEILEIRSQCELILENIRSEMNESKEVAVAQLTSQFNDTLEKLKVERSTLAAALQKAEAALLIEQQKTGDTTALTETHSNEMKESKAMDIAQLTSQFDNTLESLKSERTAFAAALKKVEADLLAEQQKNSEIEGQMQQYFCEITQLKQKLDQQQCNMKAVGEQGAAKLQQQVSELRQQCEELCNDLGLSQDELDVKCHVIEELNNKCLMLENKEMALMKEVNNKNMKLKEASDTCENQTKEIDQLQQEINKLQYQLETRVLLQTDIASQAEELNKKQEAIRCLKNEIQTVTATNEILNGRIAALEDEIRSVTEKNESLTGKIVVLTALEDEIRTVTEENEILNDKITVLRGLEDKLCVVLEKNRVLNDRIVALTGLENEICTLTDRNKALNDKIVALTNDVESMKQQHSNQIKELSERNEQLLFEKTALVAEQVQAENTKMSEDLAAKHEEIKQLRLQLKARASHKDAQVKSEMLETQEAARKKIEELEKKLDRTLKDKDILLRNLKDTEDEVCENKQVYEEELKALTHKYEESLQVIEKLESQKKELVMKLAHLINNEQAQQENMELKLKITTLTTKIRGLEQSLCEEQQKVTAQRVFYEDKVHRQQQELKRLTSVVPESSFFEAPSKRSSQHSAGAGSVGASATIDHGVVGTIQLAEMTYMISKLEKQLAQEKDKTMRLEERFVDYMRIREKFQKQLVTLDKLKKYYKKVLEDSDREPLRAIVNSPPQSPLRPLPDAMAPVSCKPEPHTITTVSSVGAMSLGGNTADPRHSSVDPRRSSSSSLGNTLKGLDKPNDCASQ